MLVGKFTVFFEDPFWIGIVEKSEGKKYSTSRVVFGPEPTSAVLHEYILDNYSNFKFTDAVEDEKKIYKEYSNPKRQQRQAAKDVKKNRGMKKAYDVMKQQYEEEKKERKKEKKEKKMESEREKLELKQKKRKQKKRGH